MDHNPQPSGRYWDTNGRYTFGCSFGDGNTYVLGRMGVHDVVLVLLRAMGKVNAAFTMSSLRASYRNLRIVLLVTICGGVPKTIGSSRAQDGENMFLGDVAISTSMIEYDLGRHSHKNKSWQCYASATAAATAKALLDRYPSADKVLFSTQYSPTPNLSLSGRNFLTLEEQSENSVQDAELEEFINWLPDLTVTPVYSEHPKREERHECDWVFQNQDYHHWRCTDASNALFVVADRCPDFASRCTANVSLQPQKLSRHLLEHRARGELSDNTLIASFFYSDREGDLQRSHISMDLELSSAIEDAAKYIVENANGVFLWVSCRPLTGVQELLHALAVPDDIEGEFILSAEAFNRRIAAKQRHVGETFWRSKKKKVTSISKRKPF
ncbi:hypothetical protein QBC40DRAFT_321990 [Triangularia verruculosa]|uniref:Nucleoside phosphorylase domain-containing protein n=1 Tax=Triangularia verruculosa TaxID=2587418 RepID=A0AAN7AYY4_9PEZI|nr:hypothetical protein QBC40DRAFT_321990 [Triangularia verruculosa]